MQMHRRDLFKLMGLTGAGLGVSRFASPALGAQSTSAPATGGQVTVDKWPFQEVRIPFKERKAKVKWPNNAKLAVRVYITTEWNSGPRVAGEGVFYKPDLYVISRDSQYTFTVGVYRAMEMAAKYGIPISSFPNGSVVAAYPDLFREQHKLGYEITARSWDHAFSPPKLSPDQVRAEIVRVTDTISQIIGERPVGWISPGGRPSDKSPEVLADLGYLWVGDLDGDDIPYGLKFGNKMIVAIPHRQMTTNDLHIFLRETGEAVRDVETAFEFFQHTFNHYYETATTEAPNMLMYGIHPYWTCWPDRIAFHDKALRYMKGFKDVWFARHRDLAQYWKDTYLS